MIDLLVPLAAISMVIWGAWTWVYLNETDAG
jgi:hypothetical protein